MTDTEKKLLQAQHRLEEAQARDRVKERKARTRRLIQGGRDSGKGATGSADDRADCTGGLSDAEAAAARLNPLGGLRETGGLPLFSPEGRTYSPPVKQAVVCLRHRTLSEGDCGFCGSLQTMPQHLRALLSSSVRLGKYRRFNRRYFSNRLRKPATGSFAAEMDGRSARPFSLLRKRNRKKESR